jgi:hypothetical protein
MTKRPAILLAVLLAACAPRGKDDPYSRIGQPPLVAAELHTATIASPDPALGERLAALGYVPLELAPNYPEAVRVESLAWGVSEEEAGAVRYFQAPPGGGPNLRVLAAAAPARAATVAAAVEKSFFRNVLGSEVPDRSRLAAHGEVLVWTYRIDDVPAARDRLRAANIPISFNAVAITSAYFGDQKLLGIRAPDGTVIELVQTAAQ